METTRFLLRADLRRRWRSWLALALLVGLAGGTAMGSLAGWRRTLTAMERFVEHNRPADAFVSGRLDRGALEALPEVVATADGGYMLMVPVGDDGRPRVDQLGAVNPFSIDDARVGRLYERPIVVDGRLADPGDPLEVVVDEELAATFGAGVGERLSMAAYGVDQGEELFEQLGSLEPTGPRFDFEVVGIVRLPSDVVTKPDVADVVYLGSRELYLSAAWDRAHRGVDVLDIGALFGDPDVEDFEVRLGDGRDGEAGFVDAVRAMDPDAQVELAAGDNLEAQRDAERAISVQASLVLAFGVLASLTGLVLAGQALRRQRESDVAVRAAYVALGMTPRAVAAVWLGGVVVVGALGAAIAVAVAVAASLLTPVGFARRAEVDPGLAVDLPVLVLGALAVLGSAVLRGGLALLRPTASGRRRPPSASTGPSDWAARLRLPIPVVTGVRAAWLQPGGRTAAVTVLVAAIGVVGGAGFAASEAKLAAEPSLWGWTWDVVVGDGNDPGLVDRELPELLEDPDLADVAVLASVGGGAELRAGERSVVAHPVTLDVRQGRVAPRVLEGALPEGDREIALGAATASQLGVDVGDDVEVALQGGAASFTVSGLTVFNLGLQADRIGEGSLLDLPGAERLGGEPEGAMVVLGFAPGVEPDVMKARLQERFGNTVLGAVPPLDVDQLDRIRHLPTAFSLLVAATAACTLAFVLALTVRRGRRELALLRTLGFVRRQLRATVAAQATALVVPAALAGALVGVVVGRATWTAVARGIGAPAVPVIPALTVVAFVLAAAVLGNVIALLPARAAATTDPATILRAE